MQAFWNGFEKRALSPGLARRAQAAVKLRLDAWNKLPLGERLSDEGGKLFDKLRARSDRFGTYALKKELDASHKTHMGKMKDMLGKQTEEHLKPLRDMLGKNK